MKKIIHLSDLHIGYVDKKTGFNAKNNFATIVTNLISQCQPADEYVIVITGDIVHKASKDDHLEQARPLINKLRDNYKVLIVPGNHDYGTGSISKRKAIKAFKNVILGDENITYPQYDSSIEGLFFIGLDSMQGELKGRFGLWADGEIGKAQLQELDKKLASQEVKDRKVVVYLHHHPIDKSSYFKKTFHGLDDAEELQEVLQKHKNVDALLFGHNHHGYPFYEHWGIPRVYDGGSTTGKRTKDNTPGPHRLIDLSLPISPDKDMQLETVT